MDIPFFVYGNPPVFTNNTNSKLAQVALEVTTARDDLTNHLIRLFSTVGGEVTATQKQIVESTLGLQGGVIRLRMATILYSGYLAFYLKRRIAGMKKRIKVIKRRLATISKIFL